MTSSAPFLIVGASAQDTHPRLDVCDLQAKCPEQFTLFILAWQRINSSNYQPTAAQYEEIAGIHGMPYTPWPGDPEGVVPDKHGLWLGYCNHASILFPTWHRIHIMLIEQAISKSAHDIAGEFERQCPSESYNWERAARELRFPFWDWTHPRTGREGLPKIFTEETVELLMPGGKLVSHQNILAYHKFTKPIPGFTDRLEYGDIFDAKDPSKTPDHMAYFKQWDRTYRWPSSTPINVTEDISSINDELKDKCEPYPLGSWTNLRSDVASMFGFPIDIPPEQHANAWDEFSNTTFQSSRPDVDHKKPLHSSFVWNCASIEQSHNKIHLILGGSGHMSDNDTSAFDPIFYLHHCNLDRLWAFWQHIYPDYVAGIEGYLDIDGMTRHPFTQSGGTFVEGTNQNVDSETPLAPFRKWDGTYWTSKDAQFLCRPRSKYYTYLPIGPIHLNTSKPLSLSERDRQRAYLQRYFDPHYDDYSDILDLGLVTHTPRRFVLSISLSQTAFRGSYILRVYFEKKEIGSVAVLDRGGSAKCGNCQSQRRGGVRVRGVVAIPHAVIVGALGGLDEDEDVVDTVHAALSARLTLPSGRVMARLASRKEGLPLERPVLDDDTTPSIRLVSCDITHSGLSQGETNKLYDFENWTDHGMVKSGGWLRMNA